MESIYKNGDGKNQHKAASMGEKFMGFCDQGLPVIIAVILHSSMLISLVDSSSDHSHEYASSLEAYIDEYANRQLKNPETGTLYDITLPSNFSGIEVSVVRIHSESFWSRGADFSFLHIPPKVSLKPHVVTLDIVYENLANWSSHYYSVPDHSLVAPVIGFTAYESSDHDSKVIGTNKLNVTVPKKGKPIVVRFPMVELHGKRHDTAKCVAFVGGEVHFGNLTKSHSSCNVHYQGHYTIVVPTESSQSSRKHHSYVGWWILGFGVGFVGLVLFVLVISKVVRNRRIKTMEKKSEKGETFETFWVGNSRMPTASMVRTQPALEHNVVP